MADIMISNLDKAGERRPFAAHGHAVLANAGGAAVLRGSFEPGWRWSDDVAPLAGTASCRVHHLGYVLSGSMRVRLDDGTERDISTGDLVDLPPGHDAWVTSDVPFEMVDFSSEATRYAVGRPRDIAEAEDAAMKLVRLATRRSTPTTSRGCVRCSPTTWHSRCPGRVRSRGRTRALTPCSATTAGSPS